MDQLHTYARLGLVQRGVGMRALASLAAFIFVAVLSVSGILPFMVSGQAVAAGIWNFNEGTGTTVLDTSGNNLNGTIAGTPDWTTGKDGGALQFNGIDNTVTVPNNSALNFTTGTTLAAWIKPDVQGTQTVLSKNGFELTDGYELTLASNGRVFLRFNQFSSGDTYRVNSTSTYPSNGSTWMHIAGTYDGTTMRIYINGTEEASITGPGAIGTNSLNLVMGQRSAGVPTDFSYDGALESVRVYDGALTSQQVAELANDGTIQDRQVFNASGDFIAPDGVTEVGVLIVGGGGSGGAAGSRGGGGGAGQVRWEEGVTVTPGEPVAVTIGAGGSQVTTGPSPGNSGQSSSFGALTAVGGGGGGAGNGGSPTSGASGGGGAGHIGGGANIGAAGTHGGNGGNGDPTGSDGNWGAGGGGGSGGNGSNAAPDKAGNGGTGTNMSAFVGNDVGEAGWFGGGGGGGTYMQIPPTISFGSGGQGGGGNGGQGSGADHQYSSTPGAANTGGGGGGSAASAAPNRIGAAGGSGVVIVVWQEEDPNPSAITVERTVTAAVSGQPSQVTIPSVEITGDDRYLLVSVSINNDGYEDIQSVTLDPGGGNQATLTRITTGEQDDDGKVELWGLLNPPLGTFSVQAIFSGPLTSPDHGAFAGAWVLSGVNQTAPVRNSGGQGLPATDSVAVSLATQTNDVVFGSVFAEDAALLTHAIGVAFPGTQSWNLQEAHDTNVAAQQAGQNGTTTMTFLRSPADDLAMAAVAMIPVDGQPPDPTNQTVITGASTSSLTDPTGRSNKNQHWQWWTGDRWDGILPTPTGWRFYTNLLGEYQQGGVVDNRQDIRIDTLWHENSLWVLRGNATSPQITRYTYSAGSYTVDGSVQNVVIPALAAADQDASPAILYRTPNGRLWAAVNNGSNVVIAVSDNNGASWTTSNLLSTSSTGVVMLSHSGSTLVMISMQNDGQGRDVRTIDQNAGSISAGNWASESLPNLPPGLTSDDHGMAITISGQIYAVSKTSGSTSSSQPLIYLLHRTPDGTWSSHELAPGPDDAGTTRPTIVPYLNDLHVAWGNYVPPTDAKRLIVPRDTLTPSTPENLFTGGDFRNGGFVPRQINHDSGLLWLGEDAATGAVVRVWQPLDAPQALSTSIVDENGDAVPGPTFAMNAATSSTLQQVSTGLFGANNRRLFVNNPGAVSGGWNLSLSGANPCTSKWTSGSDSYGFDENSANGQMTINPALGVLTSLEGGSTGLSLGSEDSFVCSTKDAITLLTASSAASEIWNGYVTGVGLSQTIPSGQPAGSYTLDLTMTVVAQ